VEGSQQRNRRPQAVVQLDLERGDVHVVLHWHLPDGPRGVDDNPTLPARDRCLGDSCLASDSHSRIAHVYWSL
jgi:hypothetical protein